MNQTLINTVSTRKKYKFLTQSLVVVTLLMYALVLVNVAGAQETNENDPLENYNRAMFEFNRTVDETVFKPIAKGYQAVTPDIVDQGVSNFFSNLGDFVVVANDLMQLKFEQAAQDSSRILLNSTFGLLGLFDVATPLGLPKHEEDFGQTLGYWGVGEGYYVVLPLLGPSTTRDIWRLPVDYVFYPVNYVDPTTDRFIMRGVELVDTRADLLQAERALGGAALDQYTFFREAYLQRRRSLVYDGNPPDELGDDIFDELDKQLEEDNSSTQ